MGEITKRAKELVTQISTEPPGCPAGLFHYTSGPSLLEIVRTRTMWASNLAYLNDVREIAYARELAADCFASRAESAPAPATRKALDIFVTALRVDWECLSYAVAFSAAGDSLSQWRAYCPAGGFSIGFRSETLRDCAAAAGFCLHPCIYNPADQRRIVDRFIDLILPDLDLSPESSSLHFDILLALNEIAPMLKHPAFAEEREWRLVRTAMRNADELKFRATRTLLVPYLECPLGDDLSSCIHEVVVGPQAEQRRTMEGAKVMLAGVGVQSMMVYPSQVPYRGA